MQTPERISLSEFLKERQTFVDACEKQGEAVLCSKCRTWVEYVGAFVSIHDARFERCSGYGRCIRMIIPYCPNCEPRPSERGCLHEKPIVDSYYKALLN